MHQKPARSTRRVRLTETLEYSRDNARSQQEGRGKLAVLNSVLSAFGSKYQLARGCLRKISCPVFAAMKSRIRSIACLKDSSLTARAWPIRRRIGRHTPPPNLGNHPSKCSSDRMTLVSGTHQPNTSLRALDLTWLNFEGPPDQRRASSSF